MTCLYPVSADEIAIPAAVRDAGKRVPKFDNGRLIVFDRVAPSLDPFRIHIHGPGSAVVTWEGKDSLGRNLAISDAAIASDGSGVVSTVAWAGSEDREFRLWVFDPQGRLIRSFSTNPFAAGHVTLDSTGAIWGFGAMGNRDDDPQADYGVFRRYSRDGNLLGQHIARSTFPGAMPPSTPSGAGFSFLTTTPEGIAAFNAPTQEWIELAADGTVLSRSRLSIPVETRVDTFARLLDGNVFFQDAGLGLYRWTEKSGLPIAVPEWNLRLRGAARNMLAVEDWTGGTGRIRFVAPPAQ